MRTAIVFVTSLAIGSALSTGFAQSAQLTGVNNMNHVAIAVENSTRRGRRRLPVRGRRRHGYRVEMNTRAGLGYCRTKQKSPRRPGALAREAGLLLTG